MSSKQQRQKIARVLREFKAGTLKGSDKKPVKNRKQAIAIALSEAGMSRQGKSDEYWDGYFMTLIGEEEEEKEEVEEGMMDESAGEARCRGYLNTVAKNKGKKR